MSFKHILLPLDGSTFAESALPTALDLAQTYGGQITLVRVVQPPHLLSGQLAMESAAAFLEVGTLLYQEAQAYLAEKQQEWRALGVPLTTVVVEGSVVADRIVAVAAEVGADIIVMSTHGWSGVKRWVFGSVADRVLHNADIPVLLVRLRPEHNGAPAAAAAVSDPANPA